MHRTRRFCHEWGINAMKIFVTGGVGFISSNFRRHMQGVDKKYEVVNYDKFTYVRNLINLAAVAENADYRFVKGVPEKKVTSRVTTQTGSS